VADVHPEPESRGVAEPNTTSDAGNGGATKSKPSLDERIKRMSLGGLIASAVVILIIGLVIGLGAGYKIEQNRTKNDVNRLKKQGSATSNASSPGASAATSVRLAGTIGSATNSTVALTGGSGPQTFLTNAKTIVVKASPGTASDIAAGHHVVWRAKPGQLTQAQEVIVLPADAKIGSVVTNATPTSMEIMGQSGNVTVSTAGATIDQVATATLADVTAGAKIVAQARHAGSTDTATEIIVLPSSSKFVA
jgi:hypothetical protein